MSQEKVNHYKNQKSNRQKLERKQKNKRLLERLLFLSLALILMLWIGVSVYEKVTKTSLFASKAATTEIDATAIDDYLAELSATETEAEATAQ